MADKESGHLVSAVNCYFMCQVIARLSATLHFCSVLSKASPLLNLRHDKISMPPLTSTVTFIVFFERKKTWTGIPVLDLVRHDATAH